MSFRRIVTLSVAFLAVAAAFAACETEQDFEACAMTSRMMADCKAAIQDGQEQCRESEVFCFDTCIVRDHPQCLNGPCVMHEGRSVGETAVFDVQPICTMPCHGIGCPTGSSCRQVASLKVACQSDADCATQGPWATCEDTRTCANSGALCETAADCNAGEACNVVADGDRFCTWKFCVPNPTSFGAG